MLAAVFAVSLLQPRPPQFYRPGYLQALSLCTADRLYEPVAYNSDLRCLEIIDCAAARLMYKPLSDAAALVSSTGCVGMWVCLHA
jgi:hypothetical protein